MKTSPLVVVGFCSTLHVGQHKILLQVWKNFGCSYACSFILVHAVIICLFLRACYMITSALGS